MNITIDSKKDFLSNVIGPISSLSEKCVINIEPGKLSCITASSDNTMVLYSETAIRTDDTAKLNIPSTQKLNRVLECVESESIELNIESNCVKYSNEGFRFTYHLLDENVIKAPAINMKKLSAITFETVFKVDEARLGSLFKGAGFATDTNKLYIRTEGGRVSGTLGDLKRHNTDSYQCVLAATYTGSGISKDFPINFETFRLLAIGKCPDIEFSINSNLGIMKVCLTRGTTKLIYVVSALIS